MPSSKSCSDSSSGSSSLSSRFTTVSSCWKAFSNSLDRERAAIRAVFILRTMRQLALLVISLLFVSRDALKQAIDAKDVAAVKAAIAAGADVNEQDEYGESPLMHTSDPEIARALIAGGAKVDLANKYGMNALSSATATGNVPMVK